MSPKQHKSLLLYYESTAAALGACGWELDVAMQPAGGSDEAATFIVNDADKATLHVPADFFKRSSDEQRRVVVHEVLHLVLDRGPRAYEDAIDAITPAGFDEALQKTARRLVERGIERLAAAIAVYLPEPHLGA